MKAITKQIEVEYIRWTGDNIEEIEKEYWIESCKRVNSFLRVAVVGLTETYFIGVGEYLILENAVFRTEYPEEFNLRYTKVVEQ